MILMLIVLVAEAAAGWLAGLGAGVASVPILEAIGQAMFARLDQVLP